MPYVPVVMLVAAVAVLVGVIVVALGRGGELAYFQPDYAPLRLDEVTATDVVLFRPNFSLWGYNVPATDEALNRIADALTERDIEISALRRQVESLRQSPLRLFRDEPEREAPPDRSGPLSSPSSSEASAPPRDARDSRDARDAQDSGNARDVRDARDSQDARDSRDSRDVRDVRDSRDARDSRDSRDVRDDEGLGRLLSRARGEPSGLGWTDPSGPLRFPDDQLSGTTPTGSGFPASGQAGANPWSPASRPPLGRPPWPPAVKPPPNEEPPDVDTAFRHTTEFPHRQPSRGPSLSSPSPAPSSATDDPPDFPGREPRRPRPPRPTQENG
ncbi:MAG TPA: hypothetical protein VGS62_11820 [Streptosporangiaceae bacterium]|nr:hypothetical protein [Streptosporangiaceae bacterium]